MANYNWLQQWSERHRSNGHSVFDLSKKMAFHLPNSMILPIKFIETVPDDHFIINMSGLMRTETMNKAAFYNGKAVFTAFFVPYKQLWHNFNQFVVMKEDKHSSRYRDSNFTPVVSLFNLIKFVCYTEFSGVKDQFGYSAAYGFARVLQYCKIFNCFPLLKKIVLLMETYEEWSDVWTAIKPYVDKFQGKKVNIWRLLAYQHIFYDFYRNKFYDDLPFFQCEEDTTVEYIDTFNVDDVPCKTFADSYLTIYNEPITDGFYTSQSDARIANILTPHYCQYRRDLYTSLLPSTQFGAVSGLQLDVSLNPGSDILTSENGLYHSSDYLYDNDGVHVEPVGSPESDVVKLYGLNGNEERGYLSHKHSISGDSVGSIFQPTSFADVLKFRRAELLQQWKQNALRAGNMVDDNFESHYGVKPYYEDDNNVRFLGQFECKLDVCPVTATSETNALGNGKVGDLAAYGVGSVAGKEIDVQVKDFGVIVICAHYASEVYYSANGIDKQNTLIEPFDYFQSEFENAGLETVSAWQQSTGICDDDTLDMSFGYTPPYTMYKTEVDEVYGEYGDMYIHADEYELDFQGSLSSWTVRRSDLLVDDGGTGDYYRTVLPLSRFYQSPKIVDSIFGIHYDSTGATDPFGFAVNFDIKAIRPMSVLGIPIFG